VRTAVSLAGAALAATALTDMFGAWIVVIAVLVLVAVAGWVWHRHFTPAIPALPIHLPPTEPATPMPAAD
jgi:hypothetical protein